jgi:hypothetical protein
LKAIARTLLSGASTSSAFSPHRSERALDRRSDDVRELENLPDDVPSTSEWCSSRTRRQPRVSDARADSALNANDFARSTKPVTTTFSRHAGGILSWLRFYVA